MPHTSSPHDDHDDFDFEPIRGLPGRLPAGEHILWQGEPAWRGIAVRVFHVRAIAIYFAIFMVWQVISGLYDGLTVVEVAGSLAVLGLMAGAAIGILSLLAWLTERTTVYTLTNKRLVMRYGIALPMSVNIPYAKVGSADLKRHPDATGDIPLSTTGSDKIAYLHLWPHVRPFKLKRPQPMLRSIRQPEQVADVLADALARVHGVTSSVGHPKASTTPDPVGASTPPSGLAPAAE